MSATQTIHPFEVAGLGNSPFRCVGMEEKFIVHGQTTQASGTCDYCSTGIRYCFNIVSHDGKRFIVGSECVRKTTDANNIMLSEVERIEANFRRDKKAKERAERFAKEREEREERIAITLAEQRAKNGGLTDAEVEASNREIKLAEVAGNNRWVIEVLERVETNGDFIPAMIRKLHEIEIGDMRGRAWELICEIWSKATGGRKGSKGYAEKVKEFETRCGITD